MGLDITAFSKLDDGDYDYDSFFLCRVNSDFPGREAPLKDRVMYGFGNCFGFRAGSYSGYGNWRNQLAELAGYTPDTRDHNPYSAGAWAVSEGPFWELINFADNEGVIGPVAAAKLAKDFSAFQEKADKHEDDYFREKYAAWRRAFEMAADNGAVDFH